MEVRKSSIDRFLDRSGDTFMIPVYQRNYSWEEDQIDALYRTLVFLSQPAQQNKTHFIGTICYKSMAQQEHSIIDGQQRITTTMLLIKAMHDITSEEGFRKKLDDKFLHNTEWGTPSNHLIKLHLNTFDNEVFTKMLENEPESIDVLLNNREKDSRIYQNYKWFCNVLQNKTDDEMVRIYNALERITIVALDVEDENPQEIFESLNSTGMALTDVDKLRNYMLMRLDRDTQERLYNDYWFHIEQNIYGDDFIVDFFCEWLVYTKRSDSLTTKEGRRGHINKENLYYAYKKYYEELEKQKTPEEITESILSDMCRLSSIYRKMIFPSTIDFNKAKEQTSKLYAMFNLMDATKMRPLILYILVLQNNGNIDSQVTNQLLDICQTYIVRLKVCGNASIGYQTAGLMLQRLIAACVDDEGNACYDNIIDNLWNAIYQNNKRYALPNDVQFKEALCNTDLYNTLRQQKVKYLLYALEQSSPMKKGLPRYDNENISIEHILPQTFGEKWIQYLGNDAEDIEIYLTKLGNLTLTTQNGELSNRLFDQKKTYYENEPFYYTKTLADNEEWNIARIRARSILLAKKAIDIWNIPVEYQHSNNVEKDINERRAAFTFSMIGIEKGEKVNYISNSSIVAIVIDDKHVEYQGKKYALSALAAKLLGKNKTSGTNGPSLFTYHGEKLSDMRQRMENEKRKSNIINTISLSDCGIIKGDILSCTTETQQFFVEVVNDNLVEYNSEIYSLMSFARDVAGILSEELLDVYQYEGENLRVLKQQLDVDYDEKMKQNSNKA